VSSIKDFLQVDYTHDMPFSLPAININGEKGSQKKVLVFFSTKDGYSYKVFELYNLHKQLRNKEQTKKHLTF
jgi:hypothetical protein